MTDRTQHHEQEQEHQLREPEQREERFVRSEDPSLTPEANRLLTEEAQRVVGRERVRVPAGTPRRHEREHATHGTLTSNLIANRQIVLITLFIALVVGGIVALATDMWWAVVLAAALHALATLAVAGGAIQMTTQTEHVAPGTAARLEEEGVGDPDRVLGELVEDFTGTRRAGGTAQVISGGHNEQTVRADEDPARAAMEQRTSMTPTSEPGPSAGDRSAVAALPWGVTLALVVLSVVIALIEGGEMWILPALVVPLCLGWVVMERMLDDRRPGARYATDDATSPALRRHLPITAFVVLGVVAFMVLMGFVTGLI